MAESFSTLTHTTNLNNTDRLIIGQPIAGLYAEMTDVIDFVEGQSDLVFTGNISVTGNFTVNGTTTTINTESMTVEDNMVVLNSNQTGTPSPSLTSGLEVERGELTNYQFLFEENTDTFKIGEIGSLQAVATREDNPNVNGLTYWNNTLKRLDTSNNLTFNGTTLTIGDNLTVNGTVTMSADAAIIATGYINVARIPSLDADKITGGTFDTARIPQLDADKIASGQFQSARIPNLDTSKIATGTFNADRIPSLDASKITTGTLSTAIIPNLSASKITSGTLGVDRIPDLDAAQITTGQFSTSRIPNLDAAQTTTGTFSTSRIPNLSASKITSGTISYDVLPSHGVLQIEHRTSADTGGGSTSAGSWATRTLNTTVASSISGGSRSGNDFILPAGTYIIEAEAYFYRCDTVQIRLYNVTDGTEICHGLNSFSADGAGYTSALSTLRRKFALTGTKTLRIQYLCQSAIVTFGQGVPFSGEDNTFASVYIEQVP